MSRAGLARIWSLVGGLLAAYAIGTWILAQGGKPFADVPGLDGRAPVVSAYEAAIAIGFLLGILCTIGIGYARKVSTFEDHLLPTVAIGDVGPHQPRSWSMRIYQAFFFLCYILIPAAAIYKLNMVVLERGILWNEADPALGSISAKNGFHLFAGSSARDHADFACAAEILNSSRSRIWLANMRCDIVKSKGLRPFDPNGVSVADDTIRYVQSPQCIRNIASNNAPENACQGKRDISELCEANERFCRGMEWLPTISPLLLISSAIFGWFMTIWLIAELCIRWGLRRSRTSSSQY